MELRKRERFKDLCSELVKDYAIVVDEFIEETPDEYKLNPIIDEDDISINDVSFGKNFDLFEDYDEYFTNPDAIGYKIRHYIIDNKFYFIKGFEQLTIMSILDPFYEKHIDKKLSKDDYKKIIIKKLLKDNIYLYQEEFKKELLDELSTDFEIDSVDVENEFYNICRIVGKEIEQPVADKTGELLGNYYSPKINEVIEKLEKEKERLLGLSLEEKTKLNTQMSKGIEEGFIDNIYGENLDERIEYLDSLTEKVINLSSALSTGVYDPYFADDVSNANYDERRIKYLVEKGVFDCCVHEVYPNGIIKDGQYTEEVKDDCMLTARMTQAYRNMTGSIQDELKEEIENMQPDKYAVMYKFFESHNVPYLSEEQINVFLSQLSSNEQRLFKLRMGIEDGKAKTLKGVGKALNVTPERVRQIEAKILRKFFIYARRIKNGLNVDDIIYQMSQGKDVLGENQQSQEPSNKQLGFAMPWVLGLLTGAVSVGLLMLGIFLK